MSPRLNKQPVEKLDWVIGTKKWMPKGDSLSSATAEVEVLNSGEEPIALIIDAVDITLKNEVVIWLSGGTDGTDYKVSVTINTAGTGARPRTAQDEFIVKVRDL